MFCIIIESLKYYLLLFSVGCIAEKYITFNLTFQSYHSGLFNRTTTIIVDYNDLMLFIDILYVCEAYQLMIKQKEYVNRGSIN